MTRSGSWNFERVAGPYKGRAGGIAWDGKGLLFTAPDEGRVLRLDPKTREVEEVRKYTHGVYGIALGPSGEVYGGQEGGRRIIRFEDDGTASAVSKLLDGRYHNQPSDLVVDRTGRVWFADAYGTTLAFGPQIYPPLDHASVLRLDRDDRRAWKARRMTFDTADPRALLLSRDEKTLYVAEGRADAAKRELRAYPVEDDKLAAPIVLQAFGSDHRGPHRGIEGMCLDADGNIVACGGWRKSGPGPFVMVISPTGAVLATHPFLADQPMRCAFGGEDLYVTTAGGELYRAKR
jgi:sugar lactone lactonase YvrE